jgi:hypothetical protein
MRTLAACFAALLPLAALGESRVTYRAINPSLEQGKLLLAQGAPDKALAELRAAEGLPGNTNRQLAEIGALEATALLALPPSAEHRQQADDALVQMFHVDPDGAALSIGSPAAQERAKIARSQRPILLHERLVSARSGRPILLRARLSTPLQSAQVSAVYRLEPDGAGESGHDDDYVRIFLEPQRNGAFEVFLRPGIGGVPTSGEHVLRYYLEARAPEGAMLDTNGSQAQPIRAQLSETAAEGPAPGSTALTLEEGGKMAHPPPPPPESTPLYKRWEIIVPAAVVIVGGGVLAAVLLQSKPQPQSGSLGRLDLP